MKYFLCVCSLVFLMGCAADDPLSRGEAGPGGGSTGGFNESLNKPSLADFNEVVLPSLENDCAMCHDNPAPDYASALQIIEVGVPSRSELYQTAVGVGHRKVWAPDRPEAEALARWIRLETLD